MRLSVSLEETLTKRKPKTSPILGTIYITLKICHIHNKTNQFKLLKHIKQIVKKLRNLSPGPRKKHLYIVIRNYGLMSVLKEIIGF
jgi:transposase